MQVVVVSLRVNVNLKAITLEDLVKRRKVSTPSSLHPPSTLCCTLQWDPNMTRSLLGVNPCV